MAANVITDLAFFNGATAGSNSSCDAITDWLVAPTTSTAFYWQGAAANSLKVSNGLSTSVFSCSGSVDLTDKIIYVWMFMAELRKMDTEANGGLRIRIEDASANWREWYVGGIDTYAGGWKCFARQANNGWTTQSATAPVITAITKVGIACKTTAVATVVNFWWDALRYGTSISINEGTEGVPSTLEDIWTSESLSGNKYGVVIKDEGIYFVQGKINIGSTTSDTLTYFKDSNQVIAFRDIPVTVGFYEIKLQGKAAISNKIFFGSDPGIGGSVITAPSALKWKLTATDTNITEFGFYGCTLLNASTIEGQVYSSLKKFKNTSFTNCAEVLPYTGAVFDCNFISSPARAVRISSASHYVTGGSYISCQTAINHTTGGASGSEVEYDYNKLMFYNNTYDIENSAVTPNFHIKIDRLGGSNPDVAKINNSGGGTTTILPITVQLTLTSLVSGSEVRIFTAGTTTELGGVEDSGTTFTYQYEYAASTYVDIVVHHLSKLYYRTNSYLLGSTNASLPISQQIDRQYLNP